MHNGIGALLAFIDNKQANYEVKILVMSCEMTSLKVRSRISVIVSLRVSARRTVPVHRHVAIHVSRVVLKGTTSARTLGTPQYKESLKVPFHTSDN